MLPPASAPATAPVASNAAPAASDTAASSQSAADLVPAAIKAKGTLIVGTDATYPPGEMFDTDGKTIIGLDADLAVALGQQLGVQLKMQQATFANIIPGLQSGKYDIGLSSFTITAERTKVVDFVTYFQAGEGFYVKAGSGKTYSGLDALCGLKVAVETGTVEETDAQDQADKCKAAGNPAPTVMSFADQDQANLAVSSGRADLGFADSQVAEYIVKVSNGQFEMSGEPFGVAPYGIALPKGNGMAEAMRAAMQQLISDGTYLNILKQWGVEDGAVTDPVINQASS
ncbi:MAG: ABC transporter substrate-binding protein [Actinomycetia bacterium]|nr:ABC transporter substrate-binding protein [Actinomycetes bacterium]